MLNIRSGTRTGIGIGRGREVQNGFGRIMHGRLRVWTRLIRRVYNVVMGFSGFCQFGLLKVGYRHSVVVCGSCLDCGKPMLVPIRTRRCDLYNALRDGSDTLCVDRFSTRVHNSNVKRHVEPLLSPLPCLWEESARSLYAALLPQPSDRLLQTLLPLPLNSGRGSRVISTILPTSS